MQTDPLLALYEEITALTRQMLLAAREENWDLLIAHEQHCAGVFTALFAAENNMPRDAVFLRRKAELIRQALDDDARIRELTEPWLAQLSVLIGNTHRQSRLHQAYG